MNPNEYNWSYKKKIEKPKRQVISEIHIQFLFQLSHYIMRKHLMYRFKETNLHWWNPEFMFQSSVSVIN